MNRRVLLCICLVLTFLLAFCGCNAKTTAERQDPGITVVATLFPQYDFARAIIGDSGTVTMLLSPGMESHTYEPTPADLIAINRCDLFLYTGEEMEAWAHELLDGLDNEDVVVCETASGIDLAMTDHGDGHNHDDHGHGYVYDPHIWTSPVNAVKMVETIRDAIISVDPENEALYTANAAAYIAELKNVDEALRDVVSSSKRRTLVFAGRFALHYFEEEYGLDHISAYDSCSAETEPSAAAIKEMIDAIKQDQIPVVYCEELVDTKTADTIAAESGAEVLVFHSCHNVSKKDFDAGVTYIDLMRQNIVNLEKGLQ